MTPKIIVLDGYGCNPGDIPWDEMAALGDLTVYDRTAPEEVLGRVGDAEYLITNKTVLDSAILDKLPNVKYIGVLATGYNVVDVEAAHNKGITVTNIPAYSTMSVAQSVFALLLAVTNRVEHYASQNREGRWTQSLDYCYWDTPLLELAGKTFGIVGLGNIGMAVAKIALTMGMKVKAFTSKSVEELPDGIEKESLERVFGESDVVSLHCPLTPSTTHIINRKSLSEMKNGAILINTGRGGLVDEHDVADALRSGKLRAFCADVLSTEPPTSENPLLKAPNSYITPHIAWATAEARRRLMTIAASNLRSFLAGHPVNTV